LWSLVLVVWVCGRHLLEHVLPLSLFVQLLYGSTTSYGSRTVFQIILDFSYELLLRWLLTMIVIYAATTTDDDILHYYRVFQLYRWVLDDVPMIPPSSGRCRSDVSSSMSLMMLYSFAIPPGGVPVVEVMICCVCAPVQLCLLMNIYYADDGSLVSSPWSPAELDKQFVSARWTLEDDDDPASSLPDLHWLNFVYCNDYSYCIRTSCLSVCHPTHCRVADVCIYPCIYPHLICIYSTFTLYLPTNQRALVHFSLLLELPINSNFANQIALSRYRLLQCTLINTALASEILIRLPCAPHLLLLLTC